MDVSRIGRSNGSDRRSGIWRGGIGGRTVTADGGSGRGSGGEILLAEEPVITGQTGNGDNSQVENEAESPETVVEDTEKADVEVTDAEARQQIKHSRIKNRM